MRFFVDIDGTLTDKQRRRSWWKDNRRQDVIDKVLKLADAGHEVILWTGNTGYAQAVSNELNHPNIIAAVGKPNVIVDNQDNGFRRRLRRAVVTPEEFLRRKYDEP